ncbi:hypothetical protein BA190_08715 [Labrys sp. WJW]|uniref:TonB-dependent receptor plug domain-containing protein n=1 Tax=Labrys sp. WJW TaxID=1737983 RepID=UPI00083080E8|nr:TonB-dependent receptor [Labrys sp. WJW]OCC05550.1 hypothetical protein BA190_08715 [Labrys sp. WJW]
MDKTACHLQHAILSAALVGVSCVLTTHALAQSAGTQPTPVELDPVIVTSATLQPTSINKVGSSVTVITADDMARQQRRTVNDVLRTVPGLNLVQSGGPGTQTSIFMRGTNSNHVKVLIDGIDVSNPSAPNAAADLGQLLTSDVERIEVLRGPQGGLYGADAIGGVISITTRKGSGLPRLTATVEGGSHGTFNQRLGLSGSTSIFNYAFGIDHFRSTDTPVTPWELLVLGTVARPNYYDNYTYSGRVGADLTDNFSVNVIARYTDSKLGFTSDGYGPCFCAPNPSRTWLTNHQLFTRAEGIWHSLDDRYRTIFGVSYSNLWSRNVYPPVAFTAPSASTGEKLKFDLRQEIALGDDYKLLFGMEHERYSLDLANLKASDTNNAAYAQLEANLFKGFTVASNIRYDHYDSFGGHFTYRLAPTYTVEQTGTQLKASVGTGFKAPTLSQLYQDFPAFGFYANPNLKPEESTGYDVGFEQPLFDGRVRVGSTYFYNKIKNLIAANADFTTNINIGRAETHGNESFMTWKVNDQLDFRADYTFTIAKNEDKNQELIRRPRHKASLQANWSPVDALHLSATLLFVGSWIDGNRDFSIQRMRAPSYTTVNLAADYDVNEKTNVFMRVDNLFDRRYQQPIGFLQPGLGVYGGIRVRAF